MFFVERKNKMEKNKQRHGNESKLGDIAEAVVLASSHSVQIGLIGRDGKQVYYKLYADGRAGYDINWSAREEIEILSKAKGAIRYSFKK